MSKVYKYLQSIASSYLENEVEHVYNAWVYGIRPVLTWHALPLLAITEEAAYGVVSFDMEHPTLTNGLALWSLFLYDTYPYLYKYMAADMDKRNILLYPHHLLLTNEKDKKLHDKYVKRMADDMFLVWQYSYIPPFIYSYIAETPMDTIESLPAGMLKPLLDKKLPIVTSDYLSIESTNPFSSYLASIPTFDAFYMSWAYKTFPEVVLKQFDLDILPKTRKDVIAILLFSIFPDDSLQALFDKYDLKTFKTFPDFVRPYLEFISVLKAQEIIHYEKTSTKKEGTDEYILYD